MKKAILFLFVFSLIVFTIQSCGSNEKPNVNADTSSKNSTANTVADGSVLYSSKCVMCHGDDGAAGTMGAADLSKGTINHETVVSVIKSGKNAMKAFGPELKDNEIEVLAKYVESLRK